MKHFLFLLISFLAVLSPQKAAAIQSHSNLLLTPSSGSCNLDWDTIPGRTYFIQYSFELGVWHYLPEIIDGDGNPVGHWFSCGAEEVYLRLQYTDLPTGGDSYEADFDNDGYSNYTEIMAGTSPFVFTVGDQNPGGGNGDQQLPDYPTPEGAAFRLNIDITEPDTPKKRIQLALDEHFELLTQNGSQNQLDGTPHNYPITLPTGPEGVSIDVQLHALETHDHARNLKLLRHEVSQPQGSTEDVVTLNAVQLSVPANQTASNTITIAPELPGTNASRVLMPILFQETVDCSGFDHTSSPNSLMVPNQGSNTVRVKIPGSSGILDKLDFESSTPANATVAPAKPVSENQIVTVTGKAKGLSNIRLKVDGNGIDIFEADVRDKRTENLVVHVVVDSDTNAAVNAPTAAAIKDNLNEIFNKQANVFFDNVWVLNATADYDTNDSGNLDSQQEFQNLVQLVPARANALDMYIVKNLNPGNNGMAFPNVGIGVVDESPEKCDLQFVIAHEIGHLLGRAGHHTHNQDGEFLMADAAVSECGCKIGKEDWVLMNP